MTEPIPVTRSVMPPLEEYIDEIRPLWESRWLTHSGVKHQELEVKLREYLGVEHVKLLVNGHAALELAMQSMELRGEVITTPFTYASTTQAIVRSGLTPVFCDIEPVTLTLDVSKIERLITDRTCAILPVHVYGTLCDVDAIQQIADRYGLKVIYDACHTFGERYKGRGVCTYGDASCLSFHASKVLHTIEGGALCCKSAELDHRLDQMRNFGFETAEDVETVGTNAKMNEFCAAMGLCNLRHIEETIERRKRVVQRYRERLEGIAGLQLAVIQKDVQSNYAYFPVVIDEKLFGADRDRVCQVLADHGSTARKYFYPLTSAFACFHGRFDPEKTPVALQVSRRVVTLPLYPDMEPEQADRVCDVVLGCRGKKL